MKKSFLIIAIMTLVFGICRSVSAQDRVFKLPRNMPAPELLEEEINLPIPQIPNYRNQIRQIVVTLSRYAKDAKPEFIVLPIEGLNVLQRGEWEKSYEEIQEAFQKGITDKDEAFINRLFNSSDYSKAPIGTPARQYINNIDGVVINNLFCGDNPPDESYMKILKEEHKYITSFDNCKSTQEAINAKQKAAKIKMAIYAQKKQKPKYSNFPKTRPFLENTKNIKSLKDMRNILVLTNNEKFGSKGEWILKLQENNYDAIVIEPFFKGKEALNYKEVNSLKFKKMGARRLVLAHMNITEAFDDKYYWKPSWRLKEPYWLRFNSRKNKHAVITEYWRPQWKEIVGKYFSGIFKLGFDGVVLDGLDNHLLFERLTPIQ